MPDVACLLIIMGWTHISPPFSKVNKNYRLDRDKFESIRQVNTNVMFNVLEHIWWVMSSLACFFWRSRVGAGVGPGRDVVGRSQSEWCGMPAPSWTLAAWMRNRWASLLDPSLLLLSMFPFTQKSERQPGVTSVPTPPLLFLPSFFFFFALF